MSVGEVKRLCISVINIYNLGENSTEGMKKSVKITTWGPLLWPLSFLESTQRGREQLTQNPDRQTTDLQL